MSSGESSGDDQLYDSRWFCSSVTKPVHENVSMANIMSLGQHFITLRPTTVAADHATNHTATVVRAIVGYWYDGIHGIDPDRKQWITFVRFLPIIFAYRCTIISIYRNQKYRKRVPYNGVILISWGNFDTLIILFANMIAFFYYYY